MQVKEYRQTASESPMRDKSATGGTSASISQGQATGFLPPPMLGHLSSTLGLNAGVAPVREAEGWTKKGYFQVRRSPGAAKSAWGKANRTLTYLSGVTRQGTSRAPQIGEA